MNLTEQLSKVLDTKATKQDEIKTLLASSIQSGETPTDEVELSIKALETEVATLETNEKRLEKLITSEKQIKDKEQELEVVTMNTNKSVTVTDNLESGIGFAKYVRAKMLSARANASGSNVSAYDIAKSRNEPESVLNYIKSATVGTTTDADFASALVQPNHLQNEFIELVRANTIFDKLSSKMTRVPFNSTISAQVTSGSSEWVGEGAEKPVTNPTFGNVEVKEHKLASIVVMTDELLRNASPSVDTLILNDLVNATAQKIDATFLDDIVQSAIRPQGILNDVTAIANTGKTSEAYQTDLTALTSQFISNNLSLAGAFYVMSEVQACEMSMLRDALGNSFYRGMEASVNDKTLNGIPVLETQNVGSKIVLVKPSELLLADDGGVQVAYSNEATINVNGSPVNLFQENKFAIRVERYITWAKRRPIASSFIQY